MSNEREALRLIHHHPGRLRLRARAFEGSPARVDLVRARLDAVPGVTGVDHSLLTGSLLVTYEPGMIEPDVLVAHVAEAADLDLPRPDVPDPNRAGIIAIEAVRELDGAIEELTGHRASLKTIIPAALAGLSIYSWIEHPEHRLPRWDNLLYWSYNVFSQLHRREIEAAEDRSEAEHARRSAEAAARPRTP
jgi:hypothetical protein